MVARVMRRENVRAMGVGGETRMTDTAATLAIDVQGFLDYSEANIAPAGESATVCAGVVYAHEDGAQGDPARGAADVRDVLDATEAWG